MEYTFRQGKVRDVYESKDSLVLIATDRVSAFDSIMPTLIPGKGNILTTISNFWFKYFDKFSNHLLNTSVGLNEINEPPFSKYLDSQKSIVENVKDINNRTMFCKKVNVLPIEFIVRGYMAGSIWKEYESVWNSTNGKRPINEYKEIKVGDHMFSSNKLKQCEEISYLQRNYSLFGRCLGEKVRPIFTPSTKSETGHDENISFEKSVNICANHYSMTVDGAFILMKHLKRLSINIYEKARSYAMTCGFIIADTKFEFGRVNGKMVIVDELLTPDSSRYWKLSTYKIGQDQDSYDKQILRNYLISQGWEYGVTKEVDALPDWLVQKLINRYQEICDCLVGRNK